ncbi:MAG: helix-turn-helix domain-containing protein [Lentisphaeria bacterium]|nr:helix-turn-helix domain-containing protein [Lentisphaeria bacterium]
MVNTSLNTAMGDVMRRCMRKRHLTQDCLAQYLGEDRKTVSQILSGKTMPSLELLERMLIGIGADQETKSQVRQMAQRLHLGYENKAAWTYANLRQLREKRGLSIPMLSNRTGLATSRIATLESGRDAPTEKEDALLRRTLGDKGLLTVGDRGRDDGNGAGTIPAAIPLLTAGDLALYSRHMRLFDIVMERSCETVCWEIDSVSPPAAVLADCRDFQLALPGSAVLAVSEGPGVPGHAVELWRDAQGHFSLRVFSDGTWRPFGLTAHDAVLAPKVWSLPVLDMVFKPLIFKIGAADK